MAKPTVFISYSHKDEDWKDRLVTHLGVLEHEGIIDPWDDQRIGGGDDWFPEIEKAINAASVAVLMISANFLTSNFILKEEVPKLLRRREKEGLRILPVIVKPCAWQWVKWLKPVQARPKDGKPLSSRRGHKLDSDLAAIAEEVATIIQPMVSAATPGGAPPGPDKVSLAKLPSTSPDLFGRENELQALDDVWSGSPKINILSLVAWGGVGKSALVNKWLSQMGEGNYRGAERVFGWSFYSQGAAEGKQNSADLFIATALKWFGDPKMADSSASSWDKGERLAELVKQKRTLLILDGVEPLQSPPPSGVGEIRDRNSGLVSVLRELGRQNPGLVVITTRLPVDDLKDLVGTLVQQTELDDLSPEAGAAYLALLGANGTAAECEEVAREYKGHALALTLLGRYLVDVYEGDVRKRDLIPKLMDEEEKGAHARKMMAAYEKWFEGKPEQNILYMLGLFDRPAEKRAIQALLRAPIIAGLTTEVQGIKAPKWLLAVKHLRSARLLVEKNPNEPDILDCHPLIREYFGEKLRPSNPQAWREAHRRLYEYYKSVPKKELPDTLEDMAPLFAAVMHGCQAGRYEETYAEVYSKRLARGNRFFHLDKLGAFGADLATLAGFFDRTWDKPAEELSDRCKGFVLNQAGVDLQAVGRMEEVAQPIQAAIDVGTRLKDWANVSRGTTNLSINLALIGDLKQALLGHERSVELAESSGNDGVRISARSGLAETMHKAGHLAEAEALFREAEVMVRKTEPDFPLLSSRSGFWYCDLLLSQGKATDVRSRISQTLEWVRESESDPVDVALDYISLGRAHLIQEQGKSDYSEGATYFDRAVFALRQAGVQEYLTLGLLARAELWRVTTALDKARQDVDEAFSICTRCGMRLYEADCHLEYARWHLANGDKPKAQESLDKARKMIEEMGYHRRDKEVKDLEAQLGV